MAMRSSLRAGYQGVFCPTIGVIHPKLQLPIHCHIWSRSKGHLGIRVASGRIRNGTFQHIYEKKYTSSAGTNHRQLTFHEDYDQEPFWSHPMKEAFSAVRSLLAFLVEQPSQLKYIEWPGFQSTLKTATLTLLLVGLLIIVLSSVDSALCYVLSLLLRRRS